MNSKDKFFVKIKDGKHICVGLDSDIKKIPKFLLKYPDPVYEFNKIIIDSTLDTAGAYKFNFAFYESNGIQGLTSLKKSIGYIGNNNFIIADAKRGDIGNTSRMYALSIFEFFKADASTINPYMGFDSLEPFLSFTEKINFILVLTSNPGSNDFQKLITNNGLFLYQEILNKINSWNKEKNCGIVFGATQLEEIANNMDRLNNIPLLIPGIGAQGGDLQSLIKLLKQNNYRNFLINSSRGIIYKDSTELFGEAAREELLKLNNVIT